MTLKELAALTGGQFASGADEALVIRGVAAIAEATTGDVTFFGNPKYLPALKKCQASVALVPSGFTESIPPVVLAVENPSLAFSKLVAHFAPPQEKYAPGIHPTAVIAPDAVIGDGVSIQPFVVVEPGARIGARSVIGAHGFVGHDAIIGEDCLLHPRVTITHRCVLGNRVAIHSGTVIGSDGFGYEFAGGKHVKIPQIGIVQIDDDVEIGANVTVDRARFGRTWIQQGTKIDNLVQIAHNVVVGNHCIIVSQAGISGSSHLGNYVTLAGQVGVVGHLEIGDQVTVGAQSGVTKSLPPKSIWMGSPAVPAAEWREQIAQIRRLEKLASRLKRLEQQSGSPEKTSNPGS